MKTYYRIIYNNGEVSCNLVFADMIPEFARLNTSKAKYPIALLNIHPHLNPTENENINNDRRDPAGSVPVHPCSSAHH